MRWINDGSGRPPRLRVDLNLGTLSDLPDWSCAPGGDLDAQFAGIRDAGFEGVQADPALACAIREAGLRLTVSGRVDRPGDAEALAARTAGAGADAATLHLGSGFESEAEADELWDAILAASDRHGLPLFVETHRATLTQDPWRTLQAVHRHPGLRFNGDFSHWYTGVEMVYGDWAAKLRHLGPVLDRIGFLHGRISSPGCIQVDVGDGSIEGRPFVAHFRELWARAFIGFLGSAGPGDLIAFAPELLSSGIFYARVVDGREESDRWEQALVLARIARECFENARASLAASPPG